MSILTKMGKVSLHKEAPLDLKEPENPKGIPFWNDMVQSQHEIALLEKVPEMHVQLADKKRHLERSAKRLAAINAGFDPYIPPRTWFTGYLSAPVGSYDYKLYKHALPENVIELYNKAKYLNLFDKYTVHAPNAAVFTDVHLTPIDPVLVGWIESTSFLIAAWDLAKDLQAGGLIQIPQEATPDPEEKPKSTIDLTTMMRDYRHV